MIHSITFKSSLKRLIFFAKSAKIVTEFPLSILKIRV